MAQKKKKPSTSRSQSGKGNAGSKRPTIRQSKKDLVEVQKDIRKVRGPIYSLNRKIKDAPTQYQQRKLKRQKKEYLASIDQRLQGLAERRSDLRGKIKGYQEAVTERSAAKRRLTALLKKIDNAEENQNWKEVERLRFLELKELGIIDKLSEAAGIELKKTDKTKFDREDFEDEGGKGYELDERSPYSVWEAIKQLHQDLEKGAFKFFVINGKRFSSDNPIEITAEASIFWISIKKKTDGTPYVNRYINIKRESVKYLYFNS